MSKVGLNLSGRDLEIDCNQWPCPNDILKRHEEIENLSPVLLHAQSPLVMAIDAPWGAGKTTFIRLWQRYLDSQSKTYLNINAWESDFTEEPLLPLLSALDSWVKENKKSDRTKKALKVASKMIPAVVNAAFKLGTFGALDIDKEYEKVAADLAGDLGGRASEGVLGSFNLQQEAMDVFKNSLKEVVSELPEGQENLIVFIDELDRCRPTYAINLLERIKHLFDIEGIVFVLSMNREQLSHSVQAVYGNSFNGSQYLKRFIDLEYHLKKPDREDYINTLLRPDFESEYLSEKRKSKEVEEARYVMYWLADRYEYGFRDLNQLIARFRLILRSIPSNQYTDSPVLVVMLFLWQSNRDLYTRFIGDKTIFNEVAFELLGGEPNTVYMPDCWGWAMGYILAAISDEVDLEEIKKTWLEYDELENNFSQNSHQINHFWNVVKSPDLYQRTNTILKSTIERIELFRRIEL